MKDIYLKTRENVIIGYFCKLSQPNEKYRAIGCNFDEAVDKDTALVKHIPDTFDFESIVIGETKAEEV